MKIEEGFYTIRSKSIYIRTNREERVSSIEVMPTNYGNIANIVEFK